MPRVIVSEPSPGAESHIPVVLAWGWKLHDSEGVPQAAATIEVGSSAVGLSWYDLERLNQTVRRAMKHYRKAALIPMSIGDSADPVHVHASGPDCWCGPSVIPSGVGHVMQVGETHRLSDTGPKGPAELIQQTG